MLCEKESSVDPGWLQKKRARKLTFRKNGGHWYWESSSGCCDFFAKYFIWKLWHWLRSLHEKTAFRKEETAFTYPSQQICWFGNWPASHYFYHLIKMLNCFWTSSGKVVNIFHLFIFWFSSLSELYDLVAVTWEQDWMKPPSSKRFAIFWKFASFENKCPMPAVCFHQQRYLSIPISLPHPK